MLSIRSIRKDKIKPHTFFLNRLKKDLEELKPYSKELFKVEVDESNVYELNVTLIGPDGPLKGLECYLTIDLSIKYPFSPPDVKLKSKVYRSHVYGEWICLDMLETHREWDDEEKKSSGFHSSYTLLGLLMNLMTYLFGVDDETPEPQRSENLLKTIKSLTPKTIVAKEDVKIITNSVSPLSKFENGKRLVNAQGPLSNVFSFLTIPELSKMGKVSKDFKESIKTPLFLTKNEYIDCITKDCWVNQETGRLGESIFGYGSFWSKDKNGKINADVFPGMFAIETFDEMPEKVTINKHKINFLFVPMINEDWWVKHHLGNFKDFIGYINEKDFTPQLALAFLVQIMNEQMVALSKGSLHNSEHALKIYLHCHRLLVYFVEAYPELKSYVDDFISGFLKNQHKKAIPNLGELLVLLGVSGKPFSNELKALFLEESFTRNVLWVLKAVPTLSVETKGFVEIFFKETKVSRQLILTQFYLMNEVLCSLNPEIFAKNYEKNFGIVPEEVVGKLQKFIKKMMSGEIDTYSKYFSALNFKVPDLKLFLEDCIAKSARFRYHRTEERKRILWIHLTPEKKSVSEDGFETIVSDRQKRNVVVPETKQDKKKESENSFAILSEE